MRFPTKIAFGVVATGVIVACDLGQVRGCNLNSASLSFSDIQYSFVLPTNCPIEINQRGEVLRAGAHVIDQSGDMEWLTVRVTNSQGMLVGENTARYIEYFDGSSSAIALTAYPAATGAPLVGPGNGNLYGAAATDFGFFGSAVIFGDWIAYATVEITYKAPAALTSIGGPDLPLINTSATWSSSVSGGVTPYTYAWYRNGALVTNSSSYSASTGTAEFGLRLAVTDQNGSTSVKDFWVEPDGVRASMSGPTFSYASTAGSSWTASGRGGYPPYTFNWYVVDYDGGMTDLGGGSTFSGYPGQGPRTLHVDMTDSHGRTSSASMNVTGIGSGTGEECDPVPPQLVCDP